AESLRRGALRPAEDPGFALDPARVRARHDAGRRLRGPPGLLPDLSSGGGRRARPRPRAAPGRPVGGGPVVAALPEGHPPCGATGGPRRDAARNRLLSPGRTRRRDVRRDPWDGVPPGQPRECVPRAGALRRDGAGAAAVDRRRPRARAPRPAPRPLALASGAPPRQLPTPPRRARCGPG